MGVLSENKVIRRESADDYSFVLFQFFADCRLILCKHGKQWIVQIRSAQKPNVGTWVGRKHVTSKAELLVICSALNLVRDASVAQKVLQLLKKFQRQQKMDEHLSFRKSYCCRFCFLEKSITLFDLATARKTSVIIRDRVSEADRQFLTICILLANDPEQIVEIADAVLEGLMAGPPLPLFATPIDDAKWWVSLANLDERKAHLFACFHSLPDHLQHDFQSYTSEYLSK